MMKGKSRQSRSSEDRVLVIGSAVVVLVFLLAYRFGRSSSEHVGTLNTEKLHRQEIAIREKVLSCQKEVQSMISITDNEGKDLQKQLDDLQDEVSDVKNEAQLEQDKHTECITQKSLVASIMENDERHFKKQLEEATKRQEELANAIALIQGKGSRTNLLLLLIKRLLSDHKEYKKKLTDTAPTDMGRQYQDSIVQKWKKMDEVLKKGGMSELKLTLEGETEEWLRAKKPSAILERYDPDSSAQELYITRKDSTGSWVIPGWNQKFGTGVLKYGTANKTHVYLSTINKHVRRMYDYVVCALALNQTGFIFPADFKTSENGNTESLINYIETPMVSFCKNCIPYDNTNEFKILCKGNLAKDHYGTLLFWRARSRIRFKNFILDIAEKFLQEKLKSQIEKTHLTPAPADPSGLEKNPYMAPYVLAVHIPTTKKESDLCKTPTIFYSKILTGKAKELSSDSMEQCEPSIQFIASTIENRVRELRQAGKYDVKVYISASHFGPDEWTNFLNQKNMALINKEYGLFRYHGPTGRDSEADAVDSMIAAWSNEIIISRFDRKSLQIGENFMMANKLDLTKAKISVW